MTKATHTAIETTIDQRTPVTEIELLALKRDRALLETMKAQAQALAKNLDDREEDLIGRIEAGSEIVGGVQPTVTIVSRRVVAWQTAFASLAARLGLDAKGEIKSVKDGAAVSFYKALQIP